MTTIYVPDSIAPVVQALINAQKCDHAYVLCIESPIYNGAGKTGKNRLSCTNQPGLDQACMLERFARLARKEAK